MANFCCLKYLYLNIVAVSDSCRYFEQKLWVMRAHGHSKNHFFLWLLHVSLISDCLFSIFFFFLGDIPWKFSEHIAYFFSFLVFCSSCSLVKKLDSLNLSQIDLQLSNSNWTPHPLSHWFTGQKKETKTCMCLKYDLNFPQPGWDICLTPTTVTKQ